ncbi:MAG: hypothetical protein H6895_08470 [Defluviimonas sp.]|uniref:adenylosuccinate lyase n=1 Tax=Albidovulum sp. TaxID=1872424 RepID=UPI001D4A9A08|nr:hypothetical protein [Paracoccaceae bacterium]MCC0064107.1 hypothetical protein [Defluviimonas sp.]
MFRLSVAAALALAASLGPALAAAGGCNHDRQARISCAQGTTWDDATRRCITVGS